MVAAVCSIIGKRTHRPCKLFVVSKHRTGIAECTDIFCRIKAYGCGIAECTGMM